MNPILAKFFHALIVGLLISGAISILKQQRFYQEAPRNQQLLIVALTAGVLAFIVNLFWPFL